MAKVWTSRPELAQQILLGLGEKLSVSLDPDILREAITELRRQAGPVAKMKWRAVLPYGRPAKDREDIWVVRVYSEHDPAWRLHVGPVRRTRVEARADKAAAIEAQKLGSGSWSDARESYFRDYS